MTCLCPKMKGARCHSCAYAQRRKSLDCNCLIFNRRFAVLLACLGMAQFAVMAEEISISEVLAHMDSGQSFSIAWVRAHNGSGGAKGSIKTINARKGTRRSKRKTTSVTNTQSFKKSRQIPLVELSTGALMTPKISHLIAFNEQRIRHWTGQ